MPTDGVDIKALADGFSTGAHGAGERREQLFKSAFGGGGETGVAEGARLRHKQGVQLGHVHARYPGSPALLELPTALCSTQRRNGNAGRAERFHIAVDGALGNFQPFGKFAPSELFVSLEQQERGEETVRFHSGWTALPAFF